MHNKTIENYFFIGFLLIVSIFSFFIFRPFLSIIVVGASISVVLHPIYLKLKNKITRGRSWIAALITVFIFVIFLFGPVFTVGVMIVNQSQDLYYSIATSGSPNTFLESVNTNVNNILQNHIDFNIQDKFSDFVTFISSNLTNIFTTTLSTVWSLFLVILTIFFFLKDGDDWKDALIKLSPLSDEYDQKIISKLSNAINSIIKGYLFIAIIQGLLMGIGLAIFGVPSPALWGVLSAVASLVPTLGTTIVAVPAILFLFATGTTFQVVGMTIWAVIIVGLVDNLLNPIIVGNRTEVPALLILFSVLGGMSLMGPVGVLIGPLTTSFLYTLIGIYRSSFQAIKS